MGVRPRVWDGFVKNVDNLAEGWWRMLRAKFTTCLPINMVGAGAVVIDKDYGYYCN